MARPPPGGRAAGVGPLTGSRLARRRLKPAATGRRSVGVELPQAGPRGYPRAVTVRTPADLRTFVVLRPDVEAVLQRCGRETYDLVLIDLDGNWTRWVFPSEEAAAAWPKTWHAACTKAGTTGWSAGEQARSLERTGRPEAGPLIDVDGGSARPRACAFVKGAGAILRSSTRQGHDRTWARAHVLFGWGEGDGGGGMVRPVVEAAGLELVEASWSRGRGRRILRVTVDREGGVDLDAIAQVSERISRRLDLEGFDPGPYSLEVSSPGMERPLKGPRGLRPEHWRDRQGQAVGSGEGRRSPGDDRGSGSGPSTIATEEGVQTVSYEEIASARTVFDGVAGQRARRRVNE